VAKRRKTRLGLSESDGKRTPAVGL